MRKLPIGLGCLLLALLLTANMPAMAYIGPGAGITMLGALWGVIIAVFLAIGAVLFWPIRILLRRTRKKTPAPAPTVATQDKTS